MNMVYLSATKTGCNCFIDMGIWKQLSEYLYLRKKDPNRPKDKWIGYMHGINRISIFVFIICLIILAIKLLS